MSASGSVSGSARLTRSERFASFQALAEELKGPNANPAQILTRLYNGCNQEFTKAEAEIKDLINLTSTLQAKVNSLEGRDIKVSQCFLMLGSKLMFNSDRKQPRLAQQCSRCGLVSRQSEPQRLLDCLLESTSKLFS